MDYQVGKYLVIRSAWSGPISCFSRFSRLSKRLAYEGDRHMSNPEPANAPEAPTWLVGRELSPGEIKEAIAYLTHKANGGKPALDADGRVDPGALAAEIRKRMGI